MNSPEPDPALDEPEPQPRREYLKALGAAVGIATLGGAGCTRVASRYLPTRPPQEPLVPEAAQFVLS
ncbi:MAG: hypothetical protein V4671_07460, partial [Armatimonadota bacterium]